MIFEKMRKKSTLIKISSVWCVLKLDRPVYYHRLLNLINTTLLTIFLQKSRFLHFYTKNRGLKDKFIKTPLNMCRLKHAYDYIGKNLFQYY